MSRAAFHRMPGRWALTLLVILICSSCASIVPEIDPPQVSVDSFESLPGEQGTPRFLIKLRIANPNKQTLDIAGISYSISILDRELISGVTNEVPVIEPYTEEVVELHASLKLFQIVRLITGLAQNQQATEALEYRFAAKIDFNGLVPTQRVEEIGEIKLN